MGKSPTSVSVSTSREQEKTTEEHSQWSVVRWNVSAYNSIETVKIDSLQLIHDSSTLLCLNWLRLFKKLLCFIDFFIDFVKLGGWKRQWERKTSPFEKCKSGKSIVFATAIPYDNSDSVMFSGYGERKKCLLHLGTHVTRKIGLVFHASISFLVQFQ